MKVSKATPQLWSGCFSCPAWLPPLFGKDSQCFAGREAAFLFKAEAFSAKKTISLLSFWVKSFRISVLFSLQPGNADSPAASSKGCSQHLGCWGVENIAGIWGVIQSELFKIREATGVLFLVLSLAERCLQHMTQCLSTKLHDFINRCWL